MTENNDSSMRHAQFIKEITESELVWVLEKEEGYATASSINFEDEEGEPAEVLCFWSEKALAQACVKNGWEEYQPSEINLAEFIENWCIGIDNDELLVGTNFDQNMFGFEIEGYELILELVDELKKNNKELNFQKFENLEDLEKQIRDAIGIED